MMIPNKSSTLFKNFLLRLVLLVLVVSQLSPPPALASSPNQHMRTSHSYPLSNLSAEEKVGQLFLVTFQGNQVTPGTDIYQLISQHHIGGVVLKRDNTNFPSYSSMPEDARTLINNLQLTQYEATRDNSPEDFGSTESPSIYIPLFVGISQEGNRSDQSEIINGLSPIPSQLSIGATWDIDLARQVGHQVGNELSLLGVNLLLGPSLDILADPSAGQSDLGVRSFGGDPFWVGEMGRSYIQGVQEGSNQKIAVIAKYFPGLGSADRLPDQEIATVRKSLDQLKQTDLAPFFSVTNPVESESFPADGLLNSHIRYQGLQGNIRATTRPISLDPQALDLLMDLEPLATWRTDGGLIISDNLGSQALRQLYDPAGTSFNIRKVALDAFIAGNDILYLGNTGSENQPITLTEIVDTLNFFAQKYREDEAFAERVDQSVGRILDKKNELYPIFNIASTLTTSTPLENLEKSGLADTVTLKSATLINPDLADLETALPSLPSSNDRLVILTDVSTQKACPDCPEVTTLSASDLENAILRLYGPLSGGQLVRANITSYSFKETTTLLDFPGDMSHMENDLFNADWILVSTLDVTSSRPSSLAFHRLLSERQDLLQNKNIIVFAFGAPYYLDATNISKITAYYGLYNNLPAAVDVAARLLFKEIPAPEGKLPVSLPGIGYDLISATSPDPDQTFVLNVTRQSVSDSDRPQTDLTPNPIYEINDLLNIRTGLILDHNGNPVPDGTPVQFIVSKQGNQTFLPDVFTKDGTASTTYLIEEAENFELKAVSSPAQSIILPINVIGGEAAGDSISPPTPSQVSPTETEQPSQTQVPTFIPSPPGSDLASLLWRNWLLAVLTSFAIGIIAYQVGASFGQVRYGIRWGLSAFITGLVTYSYFTLNLPGTAFVLGEYPTSSTWLLVSAAGAGFGWLLSFLFQKTSTS